MYVNNEALKKALAESKQKGELTREAVDMFILIANGVARVKSYKVSEDREDCVASGLEDLIKYWDRYNPEQSDNAFAFITQVAYNGIQKGWKKIHSAKSIKTISFSSIIQEDDHNYNI